MFRDSDGGEKSLFSDDNQTTDMDTVYGKEGKRMANLGNHFVEFSLGVFGPGLAFIGYGHWKG